MASSELDVGSQVPSSFIPFLLPVFRFLVLFSVVLLMGFVAVCLYAFGNLCKPFMYLR